MRFKIGVGLLLLGILISNGAVFDVGSYIYLFSCLVGAVGLVFITASNNDDKPK